jgi:hypothetical protein
MIRRITNNCICFFLLLVTGASKAQQFSQMAPLDSVKATGFYRITLNNSLTHYLKTDFSDLRITDEKGRQVPYIIERNIRKNSGTGFQSLEILENKISDSGNSLLVLKNTGHDSINHIRLLMKNAAVSRTATLSGSDDKSHWYIIDNQLRISHAPGTNTDEMVQELQLPKTHYTFYKLEIENRHNDPYQITAAGYLKDYVINFSVPEIVNPMPLVEQTDSGRQSVIHIQWDQAFHHDRFLFQATGTKFFDRNLIIYKAKIDSVPNSGLGEILGNFSLISGPARQIIFIPRIKATQFYFIIQNGDNPPLNITDLNSRQESISLITYFEKAGTYRLLIGNPLAKTPDYELEKFRDSLPLEIPQLTYGEPVAYNNGEIIVKPEEKTRAWLWPVIFAVLLLLGGLSYRLLKDMKKAS